MSIKNKTKQNKEDQENNFSEYKDILYHTFEFLKDSKDWLEYKKMKGKIDEEIYNIRLKGLINMALVYFYSLYEGFTRLYFKKLAYNDFGIIDDEFDRKYPNFHDIVENFMKGVYRIHIPDTIFPTLMKLRDARHNIAHGEKNAKSDFIIVEICYQALLEYYRYMEDSLNFFKKRFSYRKFTE